MAESEREWLPLELIKTTADYLLKKGVPAPRLDAEVLLCAVLECSRVKLYTVYDESLSTEQLSEYREMIRRRVAREPVSRILGRREFMGLDFIVTPDVLSPRPDTEILVEKAVQLLDVSPKVKRSEKYFIEQDRKSIEALKEQIAGMKDEDVPQDVKDAIAAYEVSVLSGGESEESPAGENRLRRVLDLGTGSGCIPISIVRHVRNVAAVGVDISRAALAVAQRNAEKLDVAGRVDFIESDFFAALDPDMKFDMIVSNPPYLIEGDEQIWPEVSRYDPALALYAAENGLACYRSIIDRVGEYLLADGTLMFELGAGQLDQVRSMVMQVYPHAQTESLNDHSGIERVLVVTNIGS